MDLQELKDRFRHNTKADLTDLDIALQAVPFLVRKVEALEAELSNYEIRVDHLAQQVTRRQPFSCKGSKGEADWRADLDDKKNRLRMVFSGTINPKPAKLATNNIHPVFSNMRRGCNVIVDVSHLNGLSNRVMFHFRKVFYTLDVMGAEKVISLLPPGETDASSAFQNACNSLRFQVLSTSSIDEAETILEQSAHFLRA